MLINKLYLLFKLSICVLGALCILTVHGESGPKSLSGLFQEVIETVVVIKTKEKGIAPTGNSRMVSIGCLGSGVIISEDGKIFTAAHVIQTADDILVELPSGQVSGAYVVASSQFADVALLQMESMPRIQKPAILGDSDSANIGDEVFIVGAPYGVSHTLTVGHISGWHFPNKNAGIFTAMEFLQTDAAINQGNSGGPRFGFRRHIEPCQCASSGTQIFLDGYRNLSPQRRFGQGVKRAAGFRDIGDESC